MQDLAKAISQNKSLYREIFLKSKDSLDNQISSLKYKSYCTKCYSCCNIRYYNYSPLVLKELSKKDTTIEHFIKYFVPFGEDKSYDYSFEIDLKKNNKKALIADKSYVSKVLESGKEDVYFYTCRFFKDNKCNCENKNINVCFNFPESINKLLPLKCGFDKWHKNTVEFLENKIAKDIYNRLKQIQKYRYDFECAKCATCCNFASSEFSYEELKEKAENKDNFASQFISVFVPYKDETKSREFYPEYYNFIKNSLPKSEKVYFYYCKHIKDEKLCPIYDKRPQICRDFPDNPLTFLPPSCGFCHWKDDTEVQTLLCHSLISLLDYYLDILKK